MNGYELCKDLGSDGKPQIILSKCVWTMRQDQQLTYNCV